MTGCCGVATVSWVWKVKERGGGFKLFLDPFRLYIYRVPSVSRRGHSLGMLAGYIGETLTVQHLDIKNVLNVIDFFFLQSMVICETRHYKWYGSCRWWWPCGVFQSNGVGTWVPQVVGLWAGGRNHLGQDQPAAEDHSHRQDRSLAQPWQGTLSGKPTHSL